jgi:hypothetical protein
MEKIHKSTALKVGDFVLIKRFGFSLFQKQISTPKPKKYYPVYVMRLESFTRNKVWINLSGIVVEVYHKYKDRVPFIKINDREFIRLYYRKKATIGFKLNEAEAVASML